LVIGFVVPFCVKSEAMGKKETNRSSSGSQQYQSAQEKQAGSDMVVRGTAIAVDPDTQSITVADYITGGNRTFAAQKGSLNDIKPGDRVNVTPQHDDPSRAQKIEKEGARP
jgi:hypothetical protein